MNIDLHAHTTASDGILSPEELVNEAHSKQVTHLAITDHDRLAGIAPATVAAARFGITIVPGVEVSTVVDGASLHILGLFVDPGSDVLRGYLDRLVEARHRRGQQMVELLQKIGISITFEEVLANAKGAALGRNHVARTLLGKGLVTSRKDAFERYLKKDRPAFVPYEQSHPRDAIATIAAASGRSFLAHPGMVRNQDLIPRLVEWGISGLEVVHPEHGPDQVKRYREFCRDRGLLCSGGSDYHGPNMERKGDLGAMKVPAEFYQSILTSLGRNS